MKKLAIILTCAALTSCGIPVQVRLDYTNPETGLTGSAGYSSKSGIDVHVSK